MNASGVSIRKVKATEIKKMNLLIPELFQKWYKHGASEHIDIKVCNSRKYLNHQKKWIQKNIVLVALDNDKIIGFIDASIKNRPIIHKIKKEGHINLLYVKKGYRKKGIGLKLVNQVLNIFNTKKIKHITTCTHSLDKSANDFWYKHGFKNYNLTLIKSSSDTFFQQNI